EEAGALNQHERCRAAKVQPTRNGPRFAFSAHAYKCYVIGGINGLCPRADRAVRNGYHVRKACRTQQGYNFMRRKHVTRRVWCKRRSSRRRENPRREGGARERAATLQWAEAAQVRATALLRALACRIRAQRWSSDSSSCHRQCDTRTWESLSYASTGRKRVAGRCPFV